MVLKIFAKRLLSEGRFLSDQIVSVENGCIVSVFPGTAQEADYTADILTPGLIDKHNHGALGFDANHPDEEKCARWLELLAKHGVTNVLYTTSTCTAQQSAPRASGSASGSEDFSAERAASLEQQSWAASPAMPVFTRLAR